MSRFFLFGARSLVREIMRKGNVFVVVADWKIIGRLRNTSGLGLLDVNLNLLKDCRVSLEV